MPRYGNHDGEGVDGAVFTVKTLYLVRHGEAVHNVVEHRTKAQAKVDAEACGLTKGSDEFQNYLNAARAKVLNDERLSDASLSDAGLDQACGARAELEKIVGGADNLPEPSRVLVSPLRRTLQTAAAMFPDHHDIRVHDLVRERMTGLPCDGVKSTKCKSTLFSNMDFSDSPSSLVAEYLAEAEDDFDDPFVLRYNAVGAKLEDAAALRRRSGEFLDYLRTLSCNAICVVTHKAFLRELERGPLGYSDSAEFGTGELRVYQVIWKRNAHGARMDDDALVASRLLYPGVSPSLDEALTSDHLWASCCKARAARSLLDIEAGTTGDLRVEAMMS